MQKTILDPRLKESNSAMQDHLGYQLTHWGTNHACFKQPLSAQILNRAGIPHGGLYATLLDTAMGYSGCYTGDPMQKTFALTMTLNVNFLSRPSGSYLIAEGIVTGGGKRTFFAEGSIFDASGDLIARGTGAFQRRPEQS
ncbi:MAG: PaaI family thioesterase [Cognatishimia sp.]